ncbi:MAG: hypothetical protein F6K35_33910 [Okeania sp. SIO2H7]|nr:hypothetical protein [Okeania sp. SIO2H7]
MKRWRFVVLGAIATLVVLVWSFPPGDLQPQTTTPTLQLSARAQSPETSPSPEVEASPEASPEVEPSPELPPTPQVEPSPEASPELSPTPQVETSPEVSPKPEVEVSPVIPPSNVQLTGVTLPLGEELYAESRFKIGILEGYKVSKIGVVPLIESPDGNLAYTVVVKPQLSEEPLSNQALAEMALEEFERGEGFQVGQIKAIAPLTVSLPWSGTLTQGRNTQPITGQILARQRGRNVFLLLISATDAKKSDVLPAFATLSNSLKPL